MCPASVDEYSPKALNPRTMAARLAQSPGRSSLRAAVATASGTGGDGNEGNVNAVEHSTAGTRLLDAICQGATEAHIAKLLSNGDVNAVDADGAMALHYAVTFSSSPAVVKLLLVGGADVDCPANDLVTPLSLAVRHPAPSLAVIELLLRSGADVNYKDRQGWSPMLLACDLDEPNRALIELLVRFNGKLTDRLPSGHTPYLLALDHTDDAAILDLLKAGGPRTTSSSAGSSPAARISAAVENLRGSLQALGEKLSMGDDY